MTNKQKTTPTSARKTRDQMAFDEATRDPAFLFQRRVIRVVGKPSDAEWDSDAEAYIRDDGEAATAEELLHADADGYPCAIETWETERVFASREEGEEFGKRTHYRYEEGWRVYCVPAEGELAIMLLSGEEHDDQ